MKHTPAVDSLKLTPSDVLLVETSFRTIQQQSGPAAERFFRELFSYDADLKKSFAPDPWKREEVLMELLGGIVRRMETDQLVAADLGWVVRGYPAYIQSNYHHLYFGAALVSMLEGILGPQFKIVYGAWFKLFQRVVAELRISTAKKGSLLNEQAEHSFEHPTAA